MSLKLMKLIERRELPTFSLIFAINFFAACMDGLSFSALLLGLSSTDRLFVWGVLAAVLLQMLRSGLSFLGQLLTTDLGAKLQIKLQVKIYKQIFRMSYASVSSYKVGDLVEYTKSPATVVSPLLDALNRVIVSILLIVVSLGVLSFLSWLLTLTLLVFFGLALLVQKKVIKKIGSASSAHNEEVVSLTKEGLQSLYGLKNIHIFNVQTQALEKISSSFDRIKNATLKLYRWHHFIPPFNEAIGVFLVGVALIFGSMLLTDPLLPSLLTFLAISYRMGGRIQNLMQAIGFIHTHLGETKRIEEILSDEGKVFVKEGGMSLTQFQERIEFKELSFTYPGREVPSLLRLNLTIPKNKTVGIVGHSGSGKSTLVDLLLGLYEPTLGRIFIDGIDLATLDLSTIRSKMGVVPQEPFLFHDTLLENIRFGSDATESDVVAACVLSNADNFIRALPEGYWTVIGERGHKLSGGEKQRLSLARALVRDPEILILDEATSHLDSGSERAILEALEGIAHKKTVILIAHRLSTVACADKIYVLDRGELVEQGSHLELLNTKGKYFSYWALQQR